MKDNNYTFNNYIEKILGTPGHTQDYVQRFIQWHLAKWCENESSLNANEKQKFFKAIIRSLPPNSTLRNLIDKKLEKKTTIEELFFNYVDHRKNLLLTTFSIHTYDKIFTNPIKEQRLLRTRQSVTFDKIFKNLIYLSLGDISLVKKIVDRLFIYLDTTRIIITNGGGSGHKSASSAYEEILIKKDFHPIVIDVIKLMRFMGMDTGQRAVELWDSALRKGNHRASHNSMFSLFKLMAGTPSTGDLKKLNELCAFCIDITPALKDLIMLFGGAKDIVSTQPLYLKEIIELQKSFSSNKVNIFITDPPTDSSFWIENFQKLIKSGYQDDFIVSSPKISNNNLTLGYFELRKKGLNVSWISDQNTYFREGIESPDETKAKTNLKTALMPDEIINQYPGVNSLLLSLGSNANVEHVQTILAQKKEEYDYIIILCGRNKNLITKIKELEDPKFIALSQVNDHSIGWLTKHANGIVIAGGGMTILEIIRLIEKNAFQNKTIYYISPTDKNILSRPIHEQSNIEYLKLVVDNLNDKKINMLPIECDFEFQKTKTKSLSF